MDNSKNTEESILTAAQSVFLKKGLAGARMQEIADKAKINKSLLHYYFRSKNKLFDAVFEYVFRKFSPNIFKVFEDERPFAEKVEDFVSQYIDLVAKNPFIPVFVINELNSKSPDKLTNKLKDLGARTDLIEAQIHTEIEAGRMRKGNPKHIMIDILAMIIFPFVAKPIVKELMFTGDGKKLESFLAERKAHVLEMVSNYFIQPTA